MNEQLQKFCITLERSTKRDKEKEGLENDRQHAVYFHKRLKERCLKDWQRRMDSVDQNGAIFTKEHIEHIVELNDRLKALTKEAVEETLRVCKDLNGLMEQGRKYYWGATVVSRVVVGPDYNGSESEDPDFRRILIYECCIPFCCHNVSVGWRPEEQMRAKADSIIMQKTEEPMYLAERFAEIDDDEENDIKLCAAFEYFFENQDVFTLDDIMALHPGNFNVETNIELDSMLK